MSVVTWFTDGAQIVSPAEDTVRVSAGSDVQLVCHSTPDEGPIVWSYNGMPVDPQSPSVAVTSEEVSEGEETIVVNTLLLRDVSASRGVTYMCKPEDDILNLDADEVELVVTTARSKFKLQLQYIMFNNLAYLIKKTLFRRISMHS